MSSAALEDGGCGKTLPSKHVRVAWREVAIWGGMS